VYVHLRVAADVGRVALPLVYCIEGIDNTAPLDQLGLPKEAAVAAHFEPALLGGVVRITADALPADEESGHDRLYAPEPSVLRPCTITAVDCFAWDNRRPCEMLCMAAGGG
jgi:DUF1680 family protein